MARLLLTVAVAPLVMLEASAAQPVPAVVRGAEFLNVRRGAGPEFPAFAILREGERVTVEKVVGSWATIRTTRGEAGYVHAHYLSFPGAAPPRQDAPSGPPAQPGAAGAAGSGEAEAEADRSAQLEGEVAALREQLAALQAQPASPATGLAPGYDELRAEVQKVARLTEELHQQLVQRRRRRDREPAAPAAEPPWSGSSVLVLVVTGVFLGGLVGNAYGRRRERNRRTRIRF